ncbi:MAG: protein-disulfide reductase DsbD domain-containing protein, partial [Verrucomicrobiota bacterium]
MNCWIRIALLTCWLVAGNLFGAQTKVHLLLSADSAKAGETIFAAVKMKMPTGWHTYWKNPGDSGSETEIEWTLPEGITAGEIQWPIPEKNVLPAGNLTFITYVFENEVVLLVPLKISATISPGEKVVSANVNWQECETVCVLGNKTVTTTLTIGNDSKSSANLPLIESAQKKLPQNKTDFLVKSSLENTSDSTGALMINISSSGEWDFFPYTNSTAKISGQTRMVASAGSVRLQKEIKKTGAVWPKEISGLLVRLENGKPSAGYEIFLTPAISESANSASGSNGMFVGKGATEKKSLAAMLLFAFIGGLILNIMPCVLPVIALKVLSFVNQTKESPTRGKTLGLIYGLGVLVSFLVLAGLAIGVQKAGGSANWGMALQNQIFRVVLTVLITLVALNLFGLFEITLGGSVMGAAGNISAKEGFSGAFFNGVLATVLATPCTAPFLAGAIGFAFTQSPAIILLMFLASGLGLAAPFVILC